MVKIKNLDSEINKYSCEMVKKLKDDKISLTDIDKALGVLSNDGVYGYYVYCKSKSKDIKSPIFKVFITRIVKKFEELFSVPLNNRNNTFEKYDKYFTELSEDIHNLLFFKDILERVLTYARYHAKACGDGND